MISFRASSTNVSRSIPAGGKISRSNDTGEIDGGPRRGSKPEPTIYFDDFNRQNCVLKIHTT